MNKYKLSSKNMIMSLIIIILPNLFFYISSTLAGLERVFINIDYFLPIFFLAINRKFLYYTVFVTIIFTDFLLIFGQIFPIIRISDIFYLLKFSLISSDLYKLYGFVIIISSLIVIFITKIFYKNEYKSSLLIVFNIIIIAYLATLSMDYSNNTSGKFWKPKNGFASFLFLDYFRYYNTSFMNTYHIKGEAFSTNKKIGGTSVIWKNENIEDYRKILVIVNESWGVPKNAGVQRNVLAPILQSKIIENTTQNTINFTGFTIAGELRELCQRSPIHFNLKNQKTGFENCLPHYYKKLGYKTIAVHGALSFMYDRRYWYPRVGFEEILFRDTGLNLNSSFCYSFPGNCDKDITTVISNKFKKNEKLFLYWLTLNTHSNYDIRDLDTDIFDCKYYKIEENSASCRNLKLQKQFFYNLSQILGNEEFKGTKVIIVGDHEPPIISTESSIFVKSKIPVIVFDIKN